MLLEIFRPTTCECRDPRRPRGTVGRESSRDLSSGVTTQFASSSTTRPVAARASVICASVRLGDDGLYRRRVLDIASLLALDERVADAGRPASSWADEGSKSTKKATLQLSRERVQAHLDPEPSARQTQCSPWNPLAASSMMLRWSSRVHFAVRDFAKPWARPVKTARSPAPEGTPSR